MRLELSDGRSAEPHDHGRGRVGFRIRRSGSHRPTKPRPQRARRGSTGSGARARFPAQRAPLDSTTLLMRESIVARETRTAATVTRCRHRRVTPRTSACSIPLKRASDMGPQAAKARVRRARPRAARGERIVAEAVARCAQTSRRKGSSGQQSPIASGTRQRRGCASPAL